MVANNLRSWFERFKAPPYGRRRPLVLINGLAEQAESWFRNEAFWRRSFDVHLPNVLAYDGDALHRRIDAGLPVDVGYLVEQLHLKIAQIRKGVAILSPAKAQGWVSQSQLPFSDHLRGALKSAEESAMEMGHTEVGIGHVFLGLIENPEAKGALLLINLGLDLKETHRELLESLKPNIDIRRLRLEEWPF